MNQYLGLGGQIFIILAFGLVIALVVKFLVGKVARFSPSYESVYTAVIAGYLCAAAIGAVAMSVGLSSLPARMALMLVGFAVQVYAYKWIVTGPNGEKLRLTQATIVSLLQAVIGLLAVSAVMLLIGLPVQNAANP